MRFLGFIAAVLIGVAGALSGAPVDLDPTALCAEHARGDLVDGHFCGPSEEDPTPIHDSADPAGAVSRTIPVSVTRVLAPGVEADGIRRETEAARGPPARRTHS